MNTFIFLHDITVAALNNKNDIILVLELLDIWIKN